MKKKLQDLWQIATLYSCAIIGAGFATGKEIELFFGQYGQAGLICIGFMSVLLAGLGFLAIKKGNGGFLLNVIFQPIMFFVMLAAGGTLVGKIVIFGGNTILLGCIVFACLCGIALLFDIKGVAALSRWATPILIIGIVIICVRWAFVDIKGLGYSYSPINALQKPGVNLGMMMSAIWAMLLYIGYNYMVPASLIDEFVQERETNKRYAYAGAVLCGLIVSGLAALIFVTVGKVTAAFGNTEMPLFTAASIFGNIGTKVYFSILLIAIFTSAISSGQNVTTLLCKKFKIRRGYSICLTLFVGLLLAQFGFSWLVANLYPVMGIGGLVLIVKSLAE